MNRPVFSLKNLAIWHVFFTILILCVLIFLSIRALDKYRWSDWGFGDAQTMLSLNQWDKDGWFTNRFLFLPQGYFKGIHILDEPELRHHAHGICPEASPRIGPRLWYTHYPPGYLIPYAFLFKLGLNNIFFMRMLSIFFSIGALVLMYILFSKITSPAISYIAVLFYGLSHTFFGYADTIANQPIDDLLRFAFMLLIVISTRTTSFKKRKVLMLSAWVTEFLLSLSSFDSIFFIYLWLIAWDFLERRGFRWKTYLVFGVAPLAAFFLQFLQIAWYLGLNNAIIDIKDTFLQRSWSMAGLNRFNLFYHVLLKLLNILYKPISLVLLLLIFYIVYLKFIRDKDRDRELPSLRLLILLFLCGMPFIFLIPYTAAMSYEVRLIAPSIALLIGGVTYLFFKNLKNIFRGNLNHKKKSIVGYKHKLTIAYVLSSGIVVSLFWFYFVFNDRKPVYNVKEGHHDILLAEKIKSIPTQYEPVIFDIGGFQLFWNPNYVPGYPQIHPITEYYIGSKPILCFTQPEGLVSDLLYMTSHSKYKFSPVLITGNLEYLEKILNILREKNTLKCEPVEKYIIMNKYVIILTDCLKIAGFN